MKPQYQTIDQLVSRIDEPNQTSARRILSDNKMRLIDAFGSRANHQAWKGGYLDHITEAMNIGIIVYDSLSCLRKLPFSKSDLLLALFLHDLEKPWKYEQASAGLQINQELDSEECISRFVDSKIREYGFRLTNDHLMGIAYAHGEGVKHDKMSRKMPPLAAMVHMCDVWSARGWYDFPRERGKW